MSEDVKSVFDYSDAELDAMAEEYENGTWSGGSAVVMGRPPLFDEDMETVSFRLPVSRIESIEVVTKRLGISKSEFFRHAVDQALIASAS